DLLEAENRFLQELWPTSPLPGVSAKKMAVLLNAMIDGLALQALLNPYFPTDEVYAELRQFLNLAADGSIKQSDTTEGGQ
ncbi:TetR family transcriptional regulator C-terminal domain-containing protein, partial [Salmonella enterica]|uniref:TetR family transcriptional regulator C-terminal domain-containing protein n=1 Tax=Salmonella enterica TaxID=28901 RepID=UPI0022B639BB